ncbi:tetratricopeptide repeat protein [Actomonas aquatica]|uniref:Tetratricopeptide repeat protein n=1 Tax=Actomonas aquatica TaxID=2866162 RepID=A0ABZ1C7B9_9BACT|nr:tetratricopeptide repeat protein [Opitutus sp. WL0086]WRQ87535.1 tetratricopeptide repeat protein [Opitutus sp. WL0086]
MSVGLLAVVGWWARGAMHRSALRAVVPSVPVEIEAGSPLEEALAAASGEVEAGDVAGLSALGRVYQVNGYGDEARDVWAGLAELDAAQTGAGERRDWLTAHVAEAGGAEDPWLAEDLAEAFDAMRLVSVAEAVSGGGDDKLAMQVLERAHMLVPDNGTIVWQQARLWERLRDQVKAKAAYERAVALDPTLAEAWVRLATLQRAVGESSEAWRSVQAGLAASPDAVPLLLARGRAYQERGRVEDALADFARVAELWPDRAVGVLEAAQVLLAVDRADEGTAMLERSLEIEPENPAALVLLTLQAILAGKRLDADAWFDRVWAQPTVAPADRARLAAAYEEVFAQPAPRPDGGR